MVCFIYWFFEYQGLSLISEYWKKIFEHSLFQCKTSNNPILHHRQERTDAQHDIALLQHSNQTEKFPKIIRKRHSELLTVQRSDITPIIMNKFSGRGQTSSLSTARGMERTRRQETNPGGRSPLWFAKS